MAPREKLSEDEKIVQEAKDRANLCQTWESDSRKLFVEDTKFANGDSENLWQWDSDLVTSRNGKSKPSLTINKVQQHNFQIVNDAKQNKPGVNVRPVGDGATYDAAQVFEGVVRHIEYQSNAEQAYDTASEHQVEGGIGYWRIVTDYVSDDSFDQEIYIRRVKNPLSIYLDKDISEADGSDARYGFVFEDVPRSQFEAEYPEHKDAADVALNSGDNWVTEDTIRVCEYYRKEQKKDELLAFIVPMPYAEAGQQIIVRKSDMDDNQKAIWELVKGDKENTQRRSVLTDEITWFKIAGSTIIERRPWLGKYIPIIRVIGKETVIDGKLDRKGHTRAMKDPQRMYNYWASEGTAQVALQSKTPYVAPAQAIEGLETYWGKANVDDASVLPYNAMTEDGKIIPPPQRQQPPQLASAYIQGMSLSQEQMMMSSGQYQSQFGQNENATSGKAINERQRQGDTATYHFIDNLAVAIRFTGKILIDLIPKVYDTERVIEIMAKDGTKSQVKIDPNQADAHQDVSQPNQERDQVAAIFNPKVGRYEVQSDIGPGYATRRQEAFNAMTQIASQNQQFMNVAGDLMFKAADFPMADELAERWSRTIPAAIKGDAPPPEMQQMQQQMQALQNSVAALNQKLSDKEADINLKAYDSETKRITAIGNAGPGITPDEIRPVFMQLMMEMLQGGSPEGESEQQQAPAPEMPQPAPMQPQGMM